MINSAKVVLLMLASSMVSGCLTIRQSPSPGSRPGDAQRPAEASSTLSTKQREEQRRRELSRNDPVVSFRTPCDGLFIPEVRKIMFQRVLPTYAMYVLNNSQHRYDVKYDVTLTERRKSMYGTERSTSTEERGFIIRPGSFSEFLLTKENLGAGRTVTGVDKIVILSCKKT